MLFHRFSKDVILPAGYKVGFGKKSFDRVLCGNSSGLNVTFETAYVTAGIQTSNSIHKIHILASGLLISTFVQCLNRGTQMLESNHWLLG
ncbi:hypothetical protein BKD03_07225 [Brucella sp. 09RB8471]|nr:hypothetical protein BKD03_07225 [Brucella sp. 09RB8471]